ncbi:MAG: restriction endonuclease subunit S [Acidobacteriota bacterium]
MITKIIPSIWLQQNGRRLDCGPYLSGALEARVQLERLSVPKQLLREVTKEGTAGIFNGPRFAREYVNNPSFGIPFLGSTEILWADLSVLPLLSKKQVAEHPELIIHPGWTLITCSGSIGRMAYARPDMEGMVGTQHFMRVVPDTTKIPSGYLFSYLSSKYGVPLIVGGTYGAIIQHIEPNHISDLPIPRFGESLENRAHELVEKAALNIAKFSKLCQEATCCLFERLGFADSDDSEWYADKRNIGWIQKAINSESFRAMNYDPRARDYWKRLEQHGADPLGSLCVPEFFKGKNIFKRIDVSPEYGYMLVGQRNAFHLRPEGRWISKKSVEGLGLLVPPMTTMIPSHGTLGEQELYCRALLVTNRTSKFVFSGDFFRCIPQQEKIRPGYLFAFLRSRTAFRMLRSISIGGKQQEQHPAMMWRFPIPRLSSSDEGRIAEMIDEAARCYDSGLDAEDEARLMVEKAIEEAT